MVGLANLLKVQTERAAKRAQEEAERKAREEEEQRKREEEERLRQEAAKIEREQEQQQQQQLLQNSESVAQVDRHELSFFCIHLSHKYKINVNLFLFCKQFVIL